MRLTLTTLWTRRPIPARFAILKRVLAKATGAAFALFALLATGRTTGRFAFILRSSSA
jgi:hypothetical protein